ncbi:hypothetical protein [Akkermansia sp.]|uniref:hypothetical protein n=1 Tax=Akkermansia sp. TaxID=1872421 RepID=UPI0025BE849B|nr:hypothetical protein [Akkermansia sp.]MCC8149272.1 hypothetical protein [Akkermansia sp.]
MVGEISPFPAPDWFVQGRTYPEALLSRYLSKYHFPLQVLSFIVPYLLWSKAQTERPFPEGENHPQVPEGAGMGRRAGRPLAQKYFPGAGFQFAFLHTEVFSQKAAKRGYERGIRLRVTGGTVAEGRRQ